MICPVHPTDICSNSTFSAKPFCTPDFLCLWAGNTSSSCRPYSLHSPTNYVLSLFIFCCPLEHSTKRMSISMFSLYYLCSPPPMKNCLVLHRPSISSVGWMNKEDIFISFCLKWDASFLHGCLLSSIFTGVISPLLLVGYSQCVVFPVLIMDWSLFISTDSPSLLLGPRAHICETPGDGYRETDWARENQLAKKWSWEVASAYGEWAFDSGLTCSAF